MKLPRFLPLSCFFLASAIAMNVLAAPQTDRVRVRYVPPANPDHGIIYDELTKRRVLERLREFLSPYRLPRLLKFEVAECDGEADAFYGDDKITICYEYVQTLWDDMPLEITRSGVEPVDAVIGPFLDTCLHEFAHALIDMLGLPVFGRMEDAADQMAAYIYLQLGPDESRRLIQGTAYAFMSEAQGGQPPSLTEVASQHGTPAQRAFNVLCIAYGADTELFGDIAERGGLPEKRAEVCEEEYEQVQDAYEELVGPHVDEQLAKEMFSRKWLLD